MGHSCRPSRWPSGTHAATPPPETRETKFQDHTQFFTIQSEKMPDPRRRLQFQHVPLGGGGSPELAFPTTRPLVEGLAGGDVISRFGELGLPQGASRLTQRGQGGP